MSKNKKKAFEKQAEKTRAQIEKLAKGKLTITSARRVLKLLNDLAQWCNTHGIPEEDFKIVIDEF